MHFEKMNLNSGLLVIFVSVLLLTSGCWPNPVDRVIALEDALNTHEREVILPLFTDDLDFTAGGLHLEGKVAFQDAIAWDSVLQTTYRFTYSSSSGDTVFCTGWMINDLNQAMGIDTGFMDPVVIAYGNGLIKYMYLGMTPEDKKRDQQAWSAMMGWAREEHLNLLKELLPGGTFTVNGKYAKGWLSLFREWQATTVSPGSSQ